MTPKLEADQSLLIDSHELGAHVLVGHSSLDDMLCQVTSCMICSEFVPAGLCHYTYGRKISQESS